MSFGKRLTEARKKKNISRRNWLKCLKQRGWLSGAMNGDEMKPSIEAAANMADILEVSLDYPVGKADEHLDKSTLNGILEVQKLPTD